MKEKNIILSLVGVILVLVLILGANIGFANENIINLEGSASNSSEFDVSFVKDSKYIDENIIITGSRTVSLKQVVLNEVGESKTFSIPVVNNSNKLSAQISANVFNSNTEYFDVTCNLSKNVLEPESDEAIVKITVQLKKLPSSSAESTEFEIEINAKPIY